MLLVWLAKGIHTVRYWPLAHRYPTAFLSFPDHKAPGAGAATGGPSRARPSAGPDVPTENGGGSGSRNCGTRREADSGTSPRSRASHRTALG